MFLFLETTGRSARKLRMILRVCWMASAGCITRSMG